MIMAKEITGRTVLIGMVAFFGLIIAVNMVFVYFALDSWPGLSTEKAYEQGLAYNEKLAAAEAQAAKGWTSRVTITGDGDVSVRLTDAGGTGLAGLSVDLHLKRPTREGIDRQLNLTQAEPGLYKGRAENLPAGRWTAEVTAKGAGVGDYFLVHDVLVEK